MCALFDSATYPTEYGSRDLDLIVVGNATTDHTLFTRGVVTPGRKAVAASMLVVAGGEALNLAVAASALGLRANFVGRFGGDESGADQRHFLEINGCTTEGSATIPGAPHHFATIIVDQHSGERSIVTHKDSRLTPSLDQLPAELMRRSRAFFSDGREAAFTLHGLTLARKSATYTFLDAEESTWLHEALPFVNELVAPARVILAAAQMADLTGAMHQLASSGPAIVIATKGAQGATAVSQRGAVHEQPSIHVQAVDTTGAGDAFHAGYIAARLAGWRVPHAMNLGARTASITCEHAGPRAPFDSLTTLRPHPSIPHEGCAAKDPL